MLFKTAERKQENFIQVQYAALKCG